MATHDRSRTLDTETNAPDEFERLRRFILYHLGGFTLGLVRVNDPRQRDGVIASLAEALAAADARLVRVDLANRYPGGLRNALRNDPDARAALQDPARAALALVGLEHLIEAEPDETGRPPFAAALNVERDALHAALPLPIILFLTDHAMDRLDLAAPDFFDWYSGVFRLRPAGAPELTTASRLAEPRQPYETGSLSPGTRQERLDFLEDRRAELAQQAGPEARLRLAQVLKEMGELYAGLPEFHNRQLAVPSLKQAAEIFREEGHKSDEAGALETLGGVCYWIDDYKQSRRRYEAALPLYREIGSRLGEANCIQSLGDVHVRLSEYALARQRYEAALPLYREIGSRLGEANTYTAFGDLSLAEEDFTAARERFEQALPIYREIGARLGQTYVALQTARALLGLGEKRQAVEALEQGAALARSIDGQPNLNAILQLLKQAREKE